MSGLQNPSDDAQSQAEMAAVQREIIEDFAIFSDWQERYQYLIDLGKALPEFPPALRDEAHVLQGCQSLVYVAFSAPEQALHIQAISDSAIVSGLIALVLRVYSGRSLVAILATEATFIDGIGLAKNLSVTRKNGLAALLHRIRSEAAARLA